MILRFSHHTEDSSRRRWGTISRSHTVLEKLASTFMTLFVVLDLYAGCKEK